MPDDDAGFFSSLRSYATEYVQSRRRELDAKPQTQVEGGGSDTSVTFSGQDISAADMKDVKQMRESGGIVSQAFHSKALVKFGTDMELQAEDDELEEWMHENVGHLNDVILDLGEDAMWYPYALGEIVETRTGNFSHIELIEPWTMMPVTDKYGDILYWEQHLDGNYGQAERFEPDEIGSIVLNKSSGRDKTGISEALRSEQEIETFRSNQRAMREATERIGYPFVHAKAGREGATQLNDTELRRIRNRLADIGPGETQVTGPDVDIDLKSPATVDFGKIQERDMRMLATSLGIPVELLNEGSDGLGSGMPAELRKDLLRLQNEADRRRFSDQFVEQFVRPIVRDYSPFDHTMHLTLEFDPFMSKQDEVSSLIQTVGGYLTANEVRERLNMTPIDDEEIGESYSVPEQAEQQQEQEQGMEGEQQGGEGDTGIFGAAADDGLGIFGRSNREVFERELKIPDDALRITDRSEAPEGATIVEGDSGGLAYIRGTGQDGEQDTGGSSSSNVPIEQSDQEEG